MIILLLILSSLGFILSLIVQAGTFFGIGIGLSASPAPWLCFGFLLNLLLFLTYGLIYACNKKLGKDYLKKAIECSPEVLNLLFFFILIYAFFYISTGFYGVFKYGRLAKSQGQNVLSKKGQVVRVLSEEEYAKKYNLGIRRISSIWMMAYLVPLNFSIGSMILKHKDEDSLDS